MSRYHRQGYLGAGLVKKLLTSKGEKGWLIKVRPLK